MSNYIRGNLVTPLELCDQSIAVIGPPIIDTLKASLLYWDKTCIGIPTRGFTDDLVLAADALKSLGAAEEFEIEATRYGFSADDKSIVRIREELNNRFTSLRRRPNEFWSFLPTSPDQDFKKNYQNYQDIPAKETRKIVEVALLRGLPMPDRDLAFEDILEFKAKNNRSEEIRRLHDEIEDLAGIFASETDSEEAVKKALSRLENAVSDIETVYSERWTINRKGLLKSAFVSVSMGAGTLVGNYLDTLSGAPPWASGALGATVMTLIGKFAVSEPTTRSASGLAYALEVKKI